MNKDLKEFIESFNENHVDYMVVGGIAVAYYGYPRYTGDIDIWIKKTEENAEKIISALNDFGFSELDLTVKDLTGSNMVFQFGVEPNRIDIVTDIDGVKYKDAELNTIKIKIDGVEVNLISIEDLKRNKKASARHRDLDDLENLP